MLWDIVSGMDDTVFVQTSKHVAMICSPSRLERINGAIYRYSWYGDFGLH